LPAQHVEALELLRSIRGPTQAHPGCIACGIYQEDDGDHSILLFEEWSSLGALHEHVRSELYRRVLAALELATQPPEVCVRHVSTTEGFDLIQKLRNTNSTSIVGDA